MRRSIAVMPVLLITMGLVACDGGSQSGQNDHEDHKDHKDEGQGGHVDAGERYELGEANIGAFHVTVSSMGEIEPGHEGVLNLEVSGGEPVAVRAWVGVESARGSLRAKLYGHGKDFHGHLDVPASLPEGSALWIEIEDANGEKSTASITLE